MYLFCEAFEKTHKQKLLLQTTHPKKRLTGVEIIRLFSLSPLLKSEKINVYQGEITEEKF